MPGLLALGLGCTPVPQEPYEVPTLPPGSVSPEGAAPTSADAPEVVDALPSPLLLSGEDTGTEVLAPLEPPEADAAGTLESAQEELSWEEIPFAPEAGSLRVLRSIVVRAEPREDASPIGTLAQDMRVRWLRAVKGPGCEVWVEVEPRGWVCARYLEANFRAPRLRELPLVPDGALTPGVYARVVGKRARVYSTLSDARRGRGGRRLKGSVTVKLVAEVRVRRRTFWRTSDRKYVEARFLRVFTPSVFAGLDRTVLAQRPLPLAWALSSRKRNRPVEVRAAPSVDAPAVALLAPRAVVGVLGLSMDSAWARVEGGGWVARSELRVARTTPPPMDTPVGARWLDVDLDEQVLVAYEGDTPVYATLVSSGAPEHETPEGIFRIWLKFSETDMTGRMGNDAYHVSTVPWTMFFQDDFALHTAYWHDRFGEPSSHGCINLAPQDARALYQWSEPEVPVGWSMAYHAPTHTGSLVRVRSARWPSPLLPVTVHEGSGEQCEAGEACPELLALQ
ncbi:MAG: L,D-transpeptidase family protein [Myxococcaceae bacterium]|nr:L,D-transpeptidase family protein [Myxococcaceae bacterium]